MKYREMFKDAVWFTDGTYVIGGWYSRKEAAERFSNDLVRNVHPEDIRPCRARFGFPPEYCEEYESKDGPIWNSGASGKGSKPIWVIDA